MSYTEKVLSRLNVPGLLLLAAGAVAVYASEALVRRVREDKRGKINLCIKAAGGVVALIGALVLLDLI